MKQTEYALLLYEKKELEDRIKAINDEIDHAIIDMATGWARRDEHGCCFISTIGKVESTSRPYGSAYDIANKFTYDSTGHAKAEEIAAAQLCYRLLKRFSDENGGEQIDWSNHEQYKHSIYYNAAQKTLAIDWDVTDPQINVVYFASEEIAQQAIDLFRPQIMAAMGLKGEA